MFAELVEALGASGWSGMGRSPPEDVTDDPPGDDEDAYGDDDGDAV